MKKVKNFIANLPESTQEEYEEKLCNIWKSKLKFLYVYNAQFFRMMAAVNFGYNQGNFDVVFDDFELLKIFPTDVPKINPVLIKYNKNFFENMSNIESIEPILIDALRKMLTDTYMPPTDIIEFYPHLIAIYIVFDNIKLTEDFNIVMTGRDKPFKLDIILQLDFALTKILCVAQHLIQKFYRTGKIRDKELKRLKKIREQKRKEENKERILNEYNKIDVTHKTKNRVATDIHESLGNFFQNPPSISTIKRRLEEAKLSPFI